MSAAIDTIAMLLPKLSQTDRKKVRSMLDKSEFETWEKETAKFRQLMRGKAVDRRPASKIVSEGRR